MDWAKKVNKFQRSSTVKMSPCCTKFQSLSVSMLLLLQTCWANQRTTENVCLEISPKKTCRIIIKLFA